MIIISSSSSSITIIIIKLYKTVQYLDSFTSLLSLQIIPASKHGPERDFEHA